MSKVEMENQMAKDSLNTGSSLQRWSARKTEARKLEEQANKVAESIAEPPQRELTDTDLPPIDTLGEGSDYKGFLSPKVSESLRRQALRKLFHSPRFNVSDGLDVYHGDYTCFAELGNIITQDMRHILEVEAKRLAQSTTAVARTTAKNDRALGTAEASGQPSDQVSPKETPET
jgi:hypothetical protein